MTSSRSLVMQSAGCHANAAVSRVGGWAGAGTGQRCGASHPGDPLLQLCTGTPPRIELEPLPRPAPPEPPVVARDHDRAGVGAERLLEIGREPEREVVRRLV